MNETLQQKIIESQASISEIAALLEKDFSCESVIDYFKSKGVELSADEAGEFLSLMQGARESAVSTKLSDDELTGVAGGVGQILDEAGEVIDLGRYLACKAAPFIVGCPYIIKKYENRKGGF
jgi:hypothetical protein